jgi:hypothetical protein
MTRSSQRAVCRWSIVSPPIAWLLVNNRKYIHAATFGHCSVPKQRNVSSCPQSVWSWLHLRHTESKNREHSQTRELWHFGLNLSCAQRLPADVIHTKYTNRCVYSGSWWWADKCLKHVVDIDRNKLKASSVSCWCSYTDFISVIVIHTWCV